jgi:hypothetical protein
MSTKQRKSDDDSQTFVSEGDLKQLMSDVISLREQLAQAELELGMLYGASGELMRLKQIGLT